jgi:hypothetical protein
MKREKKRRRMTKRRRIRLTAGERREGGTRARAAVCKRGRSSLSLSNQYKRYEDIRQIDWDLCSPPSLSLLPSLYLE